MGIASRELQHCNAATARAEPSSLELCRAPAVVDEVNAATARAEPSSLAFRFARRFSHLKV